MNRWLTDDLTKMVLVDPGRWCQSPRDRHQCQELQSCDQGLEVPSLRYIFCEQAMYDALKLRSWNNFNNMTRHTSSFVRAFRGPVSFLTRAQKARCSWILSSNSWSAISRWILAVLEVRDCQQAAILSTSWNYVPHPDAFCSNANPIRGVIYSDISVLILQAKRLCAVYS
jgi:hypothetical protein